MALTQEQAEARAQDEPWTDGEITRIDYGCAHPRPADVMEATERAGR